MLEFYQKAAVIRPLMSKVFIEKKLFVMGFPKHWVLHRWFLPEFLLHVASFIFLHMQLNNVMTLFFLITVTGCGQMLPDL